MEAQQDMEIFYTKSASNALQLTPFPLHSNASCELGRCTIKDE